MKHSDEESNDEVIGRLIKSAGRGPALAPAARQRIQAAVGAEWRRVVQQRRLRQRRGWTWLAAAAGLAAVALVVRFESSMVPQAAARIAQVSVASGQAERLSGEAREALAAGSWISAGDTLRTGADGRVAMALGDGLVLRIDAASELRFEQPELVALARGAIYVDSGIDGRTGVAPARADALVVRTAWGAVRHVGTQYEVRVADTRLRVRVREGAVVIGDEGAAAREITARAGEEILLPDGGEAVRSVIDVRDPAWDWAVELARVPGADAQSLHALLRWLVHETGQALRFEDAATEAQAEALIVHGIAGLTPSELLDVVRSTTALQYAVAADQLLVSGGP